MPPEQRQVGGGLRLAKLDQLRALPRCFGADHCQRLRLSGRRQRRDAGLDDAGLLGGDRRVCFAEPARVVEPDVGDHAGQWRDDVRRVEPATQAGFPQHDVARLLGEMAQRRHHRHLEKRRPLALGKSRR